MCSRVDLPEPDGPTSATISPGRTWRSARLITSRKPLPAWRKRCWTFFNSSAGLLIAQRLDRIEPGRAPGRIERRQQGQYQRHDDDQRHFDGIDDRRQLGEEVHRLVEQWHTGQPLEPAPDGLDVDDERGAECAADERPNDADAGA